jgi:hypothetical protein
MFVGEGANGAYRFNRQRGETGVRLFGRAAMFSPTFPGTSSMRSQSVQAAPFILL